ncbi:FAD-binding oxidoreductase [Paenibacillus sp. UNC499MF]|uniref:NAD(P)/FAD-dependent oxidoreductase n=1 Tax=Paenibacillus sp. UNC499MF TaxID=1502751 RepID=UPI0008A020A1|nr:FAD-dependent oxidoreductase [Paenibacillus sp. UNC499MF]SEG16734.1 Glycine/D-amino acid oxidase [Paenibacillus sp. UNC499MF]
MDLTTGKPLWPHIGGEIKPYPQLEKDIACEVLVIGSGMSGAMSAYMLTKAGFDTVLVDSREIAGGSTMANTGLIQFFNDKTLTSCIHTYGEENGVAFYKLCEEAVRKLGRICEEEGIDAQFQPRESLYLASNEADLPMLEEEYRTLSRYGFKVKYLNPGDITDKFPFTKPGAILASGDAAINPYACVNGLIDVSAARGMRVYARTEIDSRLETEGGSVFYTKERRRIRAKYAVYSTGYETQEMKRNRNAKLLASYAIASQPLGEFPGWYKECMIWETARPYLYMRTTADGRVIVGGEDEDMLSGEERINRLAVKKDILLDKARALFPELDLQAEFAWAAVFGETHDGYPLIGAQDGFPNSVFSLVYGGNGTVYSVLGAEMIVNRLKGLKHPGDRLFRFDRPRHTPPAKRLQHISQEKISAS